MSEPLDPEISLEEESTPGDEADAEPEAETSGSEVADAAAIVRLRIADASFEPWKRPPDAPQTRQGKLRMTVQEVLKGKVTQAPGEEFELAISQQGGPPIEYLGVWSHTPVAPGTDLVAFVHGVETDLRMLLNDEHCDRLAIASEVLDDTRAAVAIENRRLTPDAVLAAAGNTAERFGDLFARFVWTRVKDAVPSSPAMLDAYLRLVENPKTRAAAREAYLSALYEDLGMKSRPPREAEVKLAQSMCRLLLLPEAQPLWPEIAGVLLPNLVRADAKKPKYQAAEILTPAKLDRSRISQVVTQLTDDEERAKKLIAWLAR